MSSEVSIETWRERGEMSRQKKKVVCDAGLDFKYSSDFPFHVLSLMAKKLSTAPRNNLHRINFFLPPRTFFFARRHCDHGGLFWGRSRANTKEQRGASWALLQSSDKSRIFLSLANHKSKAPDKSIIMQFLCKRLMGCEANLRALSILALMWHSTFASFSLGAQSFILLLAHIKCLLIINFAHMWWCLSGVKSELCSFRLWDNQMQFVFWSSMRGRASEMKFCAGSKLIGFLPCLVSLIEYDCSHIDSAFTSNPSMKVINGAAFFCWLWWRGVWRCVFQLWNQTAKGNEMETKSEERKVGQNTPWRSEIANWFPISRIYN